MSGKVDPFRFIGKMEDWGKFGDGDQDEACDAERRALADHFIRRYRRAVKRGATPADALVNIMAGANVAIACVWFGIQKGPDNVKPDDFERYINLITFGYYQALSAYDGTELGVQ